MVGHGRRWAWALRAGAVLVPARSWSLYIYLERRTKSITTVTTTGRGQYFGRERTVWDRFEALGLEFLGPQLPNGRPSPSPQPGVPDDTRNVPTYHTQRQAPAQANRQLDYAFASRGFHDRVSVRALNEIDEWGPSDHCRLLIEIGCVEEPNEADG